MASEADQNLADYAFRQGAARLDRLAYQMGRATKSTDPESVHDLRVAIRRFASCLIMFRDYFPRKQVKRVRKRLRKFMAWTALVRDRDIALELVEKSGLPVKSPLSRTWTEQRTMAARELAAALKSATKRNLSDKWRRRLKLKR